MTTTLRHCSTPVLLSLIYLALAGCSPAEPPGDTSRTVEVDEDAIDLIISGDYVVTMDEAGNVVRDGAVAVDDGLIVAIGPAADIKQRFTARGNLDGEKRIVMPGLINGHSHAAMTLLRGVADDLDLVEWLQNYIFPAEVEFVDDDADPTNSIPC